MSRWERMLLTSVTAHRRAYGQFFTPEPVVACCYQLCASSLPAVPQIVDPACGDGAFLRYAAAHAITDRDRLSGCDLDPALADALATAGLLRVRYADGLDPASLPAASFDLVIGNPPYGVGGTRNGGTAPASEVRFLLRALELARPGGLVALVLPSGVLANQRLLTLRAGLLARHTLLAVIELPRATFRRTGTSAACSIVLLRNALAPPSHLVFFAVPAQLADLPSVVAAYQAEIGDRRQETGDRRQETGDRRQETGDRRQETGDRRQENEPDCRLPIADDDAQSPILNSQFSILNSQFRLPQTTALSQRLDASFWQPHHRALRDRMAARHPLCPLGALIERRRKPALGKGALIPGDHVRPSRGETKGPGLPHEYYQTREFLPTGYNYAALERCDEHAYRRLQRTAVQWHDILISCAGMGGAGRGRVCLITHTPGLSCTGDVLIVRVQRPDPVFLYMFLISHAGRAQLLRLQNGVGTANLSADELLQVEVPLVADAVQQDLAARYTPIAAAHAAAMAAALSGDQPGCARDLARAEALLTLLVQEVDDLLLA
jgi:predicted RNA methylase